VNILRRPVHLIFANKKLFSFPLQFLFLFF